MGHAGGNLAWRWASPTQSPPLPGYVRKPGTIGSVMAPHDLEAAVFLFLLKDLFIYDFTGSLLLCRLFSSCGKRGLLSSCGVWASRRGGFLSRGLLVAGRRHWGACASIVAARGCTDSVVVAPGLRA